MRVWIFWKLLWDQNLSRTQKWLNLSDFVYFVSSQRKHLFKLTCFLGQQVLYEALQPTNHEMVIWNILRDMSVTKHHHTHWCLVFRTAAAPTSLKHKYLWNMTKADKSHLLLAVHFIHSLYASHSTHLQQCLNRLKLIYCVSVCVCFGE